MRARNADPEHEARRVAGIRSAPCRAERSARMQKLNERFKTDADYRAGWQASTLRARNTPEYVARCSEQMKRRMASEPGLRTRCGAHLQRMNADPVIRQKQLDGKRGVKIPPELDQLYRTLRKKVGKRQAIVLVRAEQARAEARP
jgi:hypothetical protein